MMPSWLIPTEVLFGRGSIRRLGEMTVRVGRKALIVTGKKHARESGVLDKIGALLRASGITVQVFEGVSANPTSHEVDAAAELARTRGSDTIIGVGGGSALDAGKAVAVSIGLKSVVDIIDRPIPEQARVLPMIAVPTTAGTGAEVTKGAIIKNMASGVKAGVRGDVVFPRIAIVDPDLSAGMPANIAMATAFDALTHAIESYVGRAASPMTELFAEGAIRLFAQHVVPGSGVRRCDASHDAMALMALWGGFNVANAGTCLPHRIQQATAAVSRLSVVTHAEGLAAVYPSWIRHAYPFARNRFDRIAALLGMDAARLPDAFAGFLHSVGLPTGLAELGFRMDDCGVVVSALTGNLRNDPIENAGPETAESIYINAF